jgi:VanZ family protein
MKQYLLRFLHHFPWGKALILWALVIFYFSSLAGSPYPIEVTTSYYIERKGAHVFEYAVLAILIYGFIRKRYSHESIWVLGVLAVFGATLYGITDELHQYFTPYRGARISDVGIDFLGALLGMLLLAGLRHAIYFKRRMLQK